MPLLVANLNIYSSKKMPPAFQEGQLTKTIPFGLRAVLKPSFIISFIFFILLVWTESVFSANHFPRYPVIDNNVRFWETIYSRYSTSQAVVHDSNNPGIVYEVIPIFNHRLPGASRINKPLFKGIKIKYTHILNKLAKGIKPISTEEKRVAKLFGNVSRKRFKKAASSVRIQIGQKDRFLEGVIKSGAYTKQIKKIFKRYGLPEDLAYLPHVESSFNIKAYSKFGASGIWQFTRSTGNQFLTINYVLDERQDPILASHAAAKFLKKNYKLLGSWPLALTAYNYGPAGMLRAKKAFGSYEKIFSNYKQGHFKFASRNFYSEYLAAIRVAKRLERDPSVQREKPQQTIHITLPYYIATKDLCNHFNITVATLKRLNPALRNSVLQGKKYLPKGYTLYLPSTNRQKRLLAKIPSRLYHKKQKPTQFYRVKRGDTAGKIAIAHRISLRSLRHANNLGKNAAIFVGQNLRIPGNTKKSRKKNTIASTKQKYISKNLPSFTHNQKTKDQLPVLADSKKNKPEWKNIQKARSVVLGELSVHNISMVKGSPRGTITVQPEESLELLAGWLNVKTSLIRNLNNFSQTRRVHPDENIRIPLSRVSAKNFEGKRFDFHLEIEEDFFNAYKIVGVTSYKVRKGDTIWEICKNKFDLPHWLLKKYNAKLDFSSLRSSQRLTIPIVKAI